MFPANIDSEREEGEIIDDLDDLSDISSEEEYLLRQRLEVLENYNNVLERKEAKRSNQRVSHNVTPNKRSSDVVCHTLTDVSSAEFNAKTFSRHKQRKDLKKQKTLKHSVEYDFKKKKQHLAFGSPIIALSKHKDHKKRHHKIKTKKKLNSELLSDSSDETDYEYRNKRRKLADAVNVRGCKTDSSLTDRIKKMLSKSEDIDDSSNIHVEFNNELQINHDTPEEKITSETFEKDTNVNVVNQTSICKNNQSLECDKKQIDNLGPDVANELVVKESEEVKDVVDGKNSVVSTTVVNNLVTERVSSDEDLELLRQNALQTKSSKALPIQPIQNIQSDDEDSDTAELRVICLRSAFLKKAIEMKQKQRLRKRLSQSSNVDDPLQIYQEHTDKCFSGNNTDIESVDMDIGVSDGPDDDKRREVVDNVIRVDHDFEKINMEVNSSNGVKFAKPHEEEVEEDEDLLRAKLLISLSKNLPKLINDNVTMKPLNTVEKPVNSLEFPDAKKDNVPEEKRFIINTADSDSGSDNEATKNLTKMHVKLSEQVEFQQKLDIFLKSTRLKVENTSLPDLIKEPEAVTTTKFIPKAVNHLPRPEQLEYNNLVKRMAELEKIKRSRQAAMNTLNFKDTLKPRNVTIDVQNNSINNLEEQIALSRKKIADESAKVLKLKEEGLKLSQKFKIVATELRNIRTALTLNKHEQRSANITLSKIRAQHQMLLKRSKMALNSKVNKHINNISDNKLVMSKVQKENEPLKADIKNMQVLKSVKVNIVNDLRVEKTISSEDLSVSFDVSNNKRLIKVPKDSTEREKKALPHCKEQNECYNNDSLNVKDDYKNMLAPIIKTEQMENCNGNTIVSDFAKNGDAQDYKSPLQAFGSWNEDPYAVLCRFEVGGSCKDPDCKYFHPKPSSKP